MPRKFFLKAIGASDDLLADRWIESRPELLRQVRNPKVPRAINDGDALVYYATGHQKLIAIARATHAGADSQMELQGGEDRWPYVLHVQVQLAIPTITFAPSWDVLEIPPTSIMQKPYLEITSATYAKAWEAIVKRTKPQQLG